MSDVIKSVMSKIFLMPQEDISPESSPENIERWDSLKHMQLVLALEDELEITFPDETVPNLVSYKAIVEAVADLSKQLECG